MIDKYDLCCQCGTEFMQRPKVQETDAVFICRACWEDNNDLHGDYYDADDAVEEQT